MHVSQSTAVLTAVMVTLLPCSLDAKFAAVQQCPSILWLVVSMLNVGTSVG